MWHLPSSVKIYLCKESTDMRKSFDALAVMVEHILCQNPLSGHLFIFRNKRGNMIKCLYWDKDGYAIWYKRLEKGIFSIPQTAEDHSVDHRHLAMMLEGLQPHKTMLLRRFKLK